MASTIPSPPSTCDETPNILLLPVIIALVPINTLLIPDIDTMTPVLAFIILIRPVEFHLRYFPSGNQSDDKTQMKMPSKMEVAPSLY